MNAPGNVAIVGAGLGGLSAAVHLRLQGLPVTVFEQNERTGGRANVIERGGYRFDTGPSLLNYPWVFEQLFRAAGRDLYHYVDLIPVNPSVEFRWPDGTVFSLSSDFERLRAECERLEPGCGPRLIAWLRDAASKFDVSFEKLVTKNDDSAMKWLRRLSVRELLATGVWRSLDRELGRFFTSRYIREAFGSYGMYLGGSPFDLPGLFSILAYGELAYGLWLPRGGIYAVVSAIEQLARELGADIRTGCRVARIVSRNGRAQGVELENGAFFAAQTVVSNVDVPTTNSELLHGGPVDKQRMTPGVLTFYWGVRGHLGGTGHHTIYLPDAYRRAFDQLASGEIPDELPFYVSVASETDPELAPAGCSTVFVLAPTPVLSRLNGIDWEVAITDIRQRVLQRIGLDRKRIEVEEVWTPFDWQHRFGLHDGSAFGAAHTLFQMGPWRSGNMSRDVRGLYYTGAGTTPGTGMPMVVLSGRMTAERILAHAC